MPILSQEDIHKLELKISALEKMTSAEFKIIFCKHAWLGIKRKASRLFKKYGLDKTQDRNTILLLIVENSKELLVYGDVGIREKSSPEFWPSVRNAILEEFRKEEYYTGIAVGLGMIADNLIKHFPVDDKNKNEVSNEIIFL